MISKEHQEKAFKIGFLEEKIEDNKPYYLENFDVVCFETISIIFINLLFIYDLCFRSRPLPCLFRQGAQPHRAGYDALRT